jgi:hypothetical protein
MGGQLHASAALPPGKRPGTHCIGGWVGPRAGLDGCRKFSPHRDSIPGPSVARSYTDYAIPDPATMYTIKMYLLIKAAIIRDHISLNGRVLYTIKVES